MLNETQLLELLKSSETHWIERKQSFNRSEVKEAIVAFANAVPENQHAVLFIGIGDDGKFNHIENANKTQIRISAIAENECFPSVHCTPTIVRQGEKEIIAVVIEFSKDRPHFAGLPYVRVGSKTIKDRQKLQVLLDDLIAGRNDKARRILREKGKLVSTVWCERQSARSNYGRSNRSEGQLASLLLGAPSNKECRIEECDAHCVHLFEIATGEHISAPLDDVKIDFDHKKNRMKLVIIAQ
jgi:Schlafen, AlbA_2